MKQAFDNNFCPDSFSQSVTLKILDVNKTRRDFRNIIRVNVSDIYKYFNSY